MSDERRTPIRDDELLRSLRDLGSGYDPDLTAIHRRLHAGRPVVHPSPAPAARRRPALIRHTQAVLIPALAVLLVVGGIVMVASRGPTLGWNHPPIVPIAAEPPATLNPITPKDRIESTGSAVAGSPTGAEASPTPSASRTSDPGGAPSSSGTGSRSPSKNTDPAADVRTDVLSSSATRAIDLDPADGLDWLAVGTRSDLKQVRAKIPAPLITLTQPDAASSTRGSFRVSWVEGVPEEDHDDAADWLRVTGPDALTVTVKPASKARTVVLYAGTARARARLSIDGPGIDSSRTLVGADSSSPRGLVVTVDLPPSTGSVHLKLGPAGDGPTAEIYLAAVTLQ